VAFGAHHDMRVQVCGDGDSAVAQDLLNHLARPRANGYERRRDRETSITPI
jgi:hypothetical protein